MNRTWHPKAQCAHGIRHPAPLVRDGRDGGGHAGADFVDEGGAERAVELLRVVVALRAVDLGGSACGEGGGAGVGHVGDADGGTAGFGGGGGDGGDGGGAADGDYC